MLRFICKSVFTCPGGSKTGEDYSTFTDQTKLEEWLRDTHSYQDKSLVGCELIDEEKDQ